MRTMLLDGRSGGDVFSGDGAAGRHSRVPTCLDQERAMAEPIPVDVREVHVDKPIAVVLMNGETASSAGAALHTRPRRPAGVVLPDA